MICTDYWTDTRVDKLDPIEKLLYIYCFTNDKSCRSGCTEIPIKKIWYETWIDRDMVTKILKRFEEDGKVAYINWYLVVRNFIKYHFSGISSPEKRSKNNQLKSIVQGIKKLPKEVLEFAIWFIPEYSILFENHEELKPLASPLQAPPKGIVPSSFSLPSSSTSSSPSKSSKEDSEAEYWNKEINDLIEIIKNSCSKNWLLYSWKWQKERQAAKRLLSKKFSERISEFWMSLEEFVNNVVMVSTKIKYNTKHLTSARLIYYNREEIVNKAKAQSQEWSTKKQETYADLTPYLNN